MRLGHLRRSRAFRIVICNVVNPGADRIATHEPSIVGLSALIPGTDRRCTRCKFALRAICLLSPQCVSAAT